MPNADFQIGLNRVPRITVVDGISVRGDVLFTDDKGEEKDSIQKRATKMLQKLRPGLQKILLQGETVLSVMSARSPLSAIEQVTASALVSFLTLCSVILTNKRILFVPVKRDGTWRESVRSVNWGDIQEVLKTGFLVFNIRFKFKNGSVVAYRQFRRKDAKKLVEIASALLPAASGEQTATHGVVQLCPDCRGVLTAGQYYCPCCGLTFKNERTMVWRSIFLPGGGYFYTGHSVVAIFPAIAEAAVLVDILTLSAVGLSSHRTPPNLPLVLVGFAVVWTLETAVTILHCRRYVRDFIPDRGSPARLPQGTIAKG
jgi:hypothetical protein